MKKILFILSISIGACVLFSCAKEDPLTPNENFVPTATGDNPGSTAVDSSSTGSNGGGSSNTLAVGDVPSSFTKKVVLEENTGEWCGYCPGGAAVLDEIITDNPGRVVGVAIHSGDPMEIPAYNTWQKQLTGVTGFPNGSVDRSDAVGASAWKSMVATQLAETPQLGLALDASEANDLLLLDVYIGYNTAITDATKLTVLLIEDNVDQSSSGAQQNYSSTIIVNDNWKHSHVLRGTITADVAGDDVDLTSTENYTKVSFNDIDLSSYPIADKANVHIAAFVHNNDGTRIVYNAQECELNELKVWD